MCISITYIMNASSKHIYSVKTGSIKIYCWTIPTINFHHLRRPRHGQRRRRLKSHHLGDIIHASLQGVQHLLTEPQLRRLDQTGGHSIFHTADAFYGPIAINSFSTPPMLPRAFDNRATKSFSPLQYI